MKPTDYSKIAFWLAISGSVALAGCLIFYVFYFHHDTVGGTNDWGAFGDFVSGIGGTVIALATLVAIAVTLSLQAAELDATKSLLAEQGKTLHRQALEATFFRMLELFDQTSAALQRLDERTGALNMMQGEITSLPDKKQQMADCWIDAYRKVYANYHHVLAPYFRAFYHVLKLVDEADLTDDEKARYTSIVRARLSTKDLQLQLINAGFGDEGRKGLKPLIERYGMLKHATLIAFPAHLEAIKLSTIDPRAFMSRAERLAISPTL